MSEIKKALGIFIAAILFLVVVGFFASLMLFLAFTWGGIPYPWL